MILQGIFIIIGLLFLLLFIGLPIYVYLRYRNRKRAWERIKQHFGFNEENSYRLKGSWNGETFTISYQPGSRYRRGSLMISLNASFEEIPTGTLRTERWWDKVGKASGLTREFQSMSAEFNEAIYIDSDDGRFKNLLRNASFQRSITSLIENRHSRLHISQGYSHGSVDWHSNVYYGFWKRMTDPSRLERIFSSMIELKKHLEKQEDLGPSQEYSREEIPPPSKLVTWIGFGVPILSIFLGIILFIWGMYYPPFTNRLYISGLKIAGICFLIYLPFAYLCFRGDSKSHLNFFGFSACAFFGLPLFLMGMLTTINGYMDDGSYEWRKGHPVYLDYDDGEYFVTVKSTHNGIQGEPEIEISEQLYNKLQKGYRVDLKVKDGYLSEPWVVELKLNR